MEFSACGQWPRLRRDKQSQGPDCVISWSFRTLYLRAFLERNVDEIAGDPGNDIHSFLRMGLASELDIVGDLTLNGMADRHCRRLGRPDLRALLLAASKHGHDQETRRADSL